MPTSDLQGEALLFESFMRQYKSGEDVLAFVLDSGQRMASKARTMAPAGHRWSGSSIDKCTELASWFPILRGVPGTAPFNPGELDEWAATSPEAGHAATLAAAFVLQVFNSIVEWRCGPFNLGAAVRCWDHEQWAAFARWVASPCTP